MKYTRFLTATVDWKDDTFESKMNTAFSAIKSNIPVVLEMVGSDLMQDLQTRIQEDVYAKYDPIRYPRRKDYPQFGTALDSEKNFTTKVKGDTLEFDYSPDGTHTGKKRDMLGYQENLFYDGDKPLKPNPVHGDVLINRIEKGKGYDWKNDMPARPFWSNFVEREFNGELLTHFDRAVRATIMTNDKTEFPYRYYSAKPEDLIHDHNDGALSTGRTWGTYDDDDDLPF